jgi:hypothetical protein
MEIYTPTGVTDPVFEGYLEAPQSALRAEQTKAQIGRPEWWFLSDLLDKEWKPPQGDSTYLLVRLAFSLEPPRSHDIEEARLTVNLACRDVEVTEQPTAFDLFPRELMEESLTDVKMTLGPSLKLEKVEGSVGSLETTVHIPKIEPVITSFGIGGSNPKWTFRKHRRHPIVGSRLVYAIVAYPSIAKQMEVSLELEATVRAGRFGLWSMKVPEKAHAQLVRAIP